MSSPPEVPLKASSKRFKPHLSITTNNRNYRDLNDSDPIIDNNHSPEPRTEDLFEHGVPVPSPRPFTRRIPSFGSHIFGSHLEPAGETPRIPRHSNNADQAKMKTQIANAMRNEIVETDWESFKSHYMTFFPTEEELDTYMQAITEADPKLLQHGESGYKFKGKFKTTKTREEKFFAPLQKMSDKIADVVEEIRIDGEHSKPNICHKLVLDPRRRNISSIGGATHIMDGYFHSTADEDEDCTNHFTSVAVCVEFKKNDGPQDRGLIVQNRRQIVAGAHFIINNDPRRMFTFGIAVEGGDCCVWYFSRSHTAKSKSFKWKDIGLREFIGTIIAFTFATPEELGYDATITLIRTPQECFVFRIDEEVTEGTQVVKKSRFFKTEKTLSELHTTCITGRATRVWTAVEVKSEHDITPINAQTVVLKDGWLDADARTERSIQNEIFDSIEAFQKNLSEIHPGLPPELEELDPSFRDQITNLLSDGNRYRDHFLTIITDAVSEPGLRVADGSVHMKNLLHDSDPPPPIKASSSHADPSRGQSYPGAFVEVRNLYLPPRAFTAKKRCRVVFKEVCSPIPRQTNFSEVMTAMEGALLAIFLLFAAGWVHRDISSGNILWYKPSEETGDNSRGILSDLEYAKRFPQEPGSADPKTGTPYYMPTEVLRAEYFLLLDKSPALPSTLRGFAMLETQLQSFVASTMEDRPVKHNFLHDVESYFWVFLWIICSALPNPNLNLIRTARVIFSDPFCDIECLRAREKVFTSAGTYFKRSILDHLDKSLSGIKVWITAVVKSFDHLYKHIQAPDSDQDDCRKYKLAINIVFFYAMQLISHAKAAPVPAIHFKSISALLANQEPRKVLVGNGRVVVSQSIASPASPEPQTFEASDAPTTLSQNMALGLSQELQKPEADDTHTVVSQNRLSEKRKSVDSPVVGYGDDMPPPSKRSRTSREVGPSERTLRSQSKKDKEGAIYSTRLQSERRKPSGSRKSRESRR